MTTDSKAMHTPGPWEADWGDEGVSIYERSSRRKDRIAILDCDALDSPDARLIAQAPRMYQWLSAHYAIEEGPGKTDRPQYEELRALLLEIEGA